MRRGFRIAALGMCLALIGSGAFAYKLNPLSSHIKRPLAYGYSYAPSSHGGNGHHGPPATGCPLPSCAIPLVTVGS